MSQVCDTFVNLHDNDHRIVHEGSKHLLIDDGLIVVVALDRSLCLAYIELKLRAVAVQ